MGDSDFPTYATTGQNQYAQRYLFTHLFEEYSRLGFSWYQDKHLAISGLEQRLTKAFNDTSGAGVFKKWQGRCLLWTRAAGVDQLTPIDFTNVREGKDDSKSPNQVKPKMPPSWSWMAYEGGINYHEPPDQQLEWNDLVNVHLTGSAETSWIYAEEDLRMEAEVREFAICEDEDQAEIDLIYDNPIDDPRILGSGPCAGKCIKIGTLDARVYVLIVRLKTGKATYERIGAGHLPEDFIKAPDPTMRNAVVE
jgi:hypothetical protein